MKSIQLLEAIASLSIQLFVFVALLRALQARITSSVSRERLWTTGLILICLSTIVVMALPHLRLWPNGILNSLLVAIDTTAFDRLGNAVLIIWLLGAVATLTKLSLSITSAAGFVARSTPANLSRSGVSDLWQEELQKTPVPGRHHPQLLTSSRSTGPACWQFHKPVIVLPPAILAHCPLAELRMMIRHELIHLSRQHPIQLFLQRLLEIVFWFHPSAWRFSEELSKSREMACDELCIESTADARAYLRSLLTLTSFRQNGMELPDELLAFRKGRDWVGERAGEISARSWENEPGESLWRPTVAVIVSAVLITFCIRLPLDQETSRKELWSPWPEWSAQTLQAAGIDVRDYEPHRYRLNRNEHHNAVLPGRYED